MYRWHDPTDRRSPGLPFQNVSGNIEREHFVDGAVEDIITALSCDRGLFVTAEMRRLPTRAARSTSAKSDAISVCAMSSKDRYVRPAAGFRITGQLIAAPTGSASLGQPIVAEQARADHCDGVFHGAVGTSNTRRRSMCWHGITCTRPF